VSAPDEAGRVASLRAEYSAAADAAGLDLDPAPLDALEVLAALLSGLRAAEQRPARAALVAGYLQAGTDGLGAAWADPRLQPEAERLLMLVGAVDGCKGRAENMRRLARSEARRLEAESRADAAAPSEMGEAAPCDLDGYRLPGGFRVDTSGRLCVVEAGAGYDELRPIAQRPLFIVGASVSPATGEHFVDVAWPSPSGQRETRRTVPRTTIANARELVTLAGAGAPVDSLNAGAMVGYLSRLEAENAALLAPRVRLNCMGWADLDGDRRAFVVGTDALGPDAGSVEVCPADGAGEHLQGWRPRGTPEGWHAAVEGVLAHYPVPGVLYLAALASPLLRVVGCRSFVVDLSGETSHGKTTAMALAASCWGDPADGRGVLHTWDGTEVAVERLAQMVGNLPLLLDETKLSGGSRARDPSRILYRLASGRGKDRGKPDGLRATARWHFVALSTGEAPVTASSEHAGTRARVLSITDLPFGATSSEGARVTRALVAALGAHHGHAGRRLARWLVEASESDLGTLRDRYRALSDTWAGRSSGGVGSRLADLAAALLLAAEVAQRLALPCPDLPACEAVLDRAIHRGVAEADRPRAALLDLLSWLGSNPSRVVELRDDQGAPSAGWLGKLDKGTAWSAVAREARDYLERRGYDVPGVIRAWTDRGWLRTARSGPTRPVRLDGGVQVRCFVIPWDVCEGVVGDLDAAAKGAA
jgi:hypothetical protein